MFFGHLSKSLSFWHVLSSSLHTSVCLLGLVPAKLIPNIHTLCGFLPFCCLIWKKKPNSKYCTGTPLSLIKPFLLLLPLFGPKPFPSHVPTAQRLLSLQMETIPLTFLLLPNLYHLLSFPCSSTMFYVLSLFLCPFSSASGDDLLLSGQNWPRVA